MSFQQHIAIRRSKTFSQKLSADSKDATHRIFTTPVKISYEDYIKHIDSWLDYNKKEFQLTKLDFRGSYYPKLIFLPTYSPSGKRIIRNKPEDEDDIYGIRYIFNLCNMTDFGILKFYISVYNVPKALKVAPQSFSFTPLSITKKIYEEKVLVQLHCIWKTNDAKYNFLDIQGDVQHYILQKLVKECELDLILNGEDEKEEANRFPVLGDELDEEIGSDYIFVTSDFKSLQRIQLFLQNEIYSVPPTTDMTKVEFPEKTKLLYKSKFEEEIDGSKNVKSKFDKFKNDGYLKFDKIDFLYSEISKTIKKYF